MFSMLSSFVPISDIDESISYINSERLGENLQDLSPKKCSDE